ncbi:MAG TPA: sulfide/dihydroorotate dehydrogenase-like FAD/NAD-binding protein [Acidimicrobiia bacterium]|jgi:ferredoxin--NADP+ reductase|nr:sulfide/dihydroorotate dehydrogenase-like FAD/NAD-binding protein [Acidimicrobiia bacterium]
MFRILDAGWLAPSVKRFCIQAPRVATKRRAGQFVILRVAQDGERIPLTIADSDPAAGSITLIVQGVGKTTMALNRLGTGDAVADIAGPLGVPSEIERYGTVVVIGGGVGTAIAYPTAVAMKDGGNEVLAIVGGRSREFVILERELTAVCDAVFPVTDDGSYGESGFVTDVLVRLIDEGRTIDRVLAIGPVPMMRAVADVTRPHRIPTVVSLNPIMVDGTGMCGGCRVGVGGETKFACVDGPEFDAHDVDFDLLMRRNRAYAGFEERRREAAACLVETVGGADG